MVLVVLKTRVKQALSKTGLPDLDYALNPYIGCSHGCIYCYAREYTRDTRIAENWGRIVVVKENLIEVLDKETRKIRRGVVGLATITDPYQPVEAVYEITRRALEILLERGFHVSIQTKSTLVLRDLDILEKYKNRVDVGFTITTLDNSKARRIEPSSSPPTARAEALRKISSRGIETWVFMGPIIPGLTDNIGDIEEIVLLASETRSVLYYDKLRIKPFMQKTGSLSMLASKTGKYSWQSIYKLVNDLCRRHNVVCKPGFEYPPENKIATLDKYISSP